jgi:hypothetical protein
MSVMNVSIQVLNIKFGEILLTKLLAIIMIK